MTEVVALHFKHPPDEVLRWLVKCGVDIRDVYRLKVLKRNEDGSGEVMLWLLCRNEKGEWYLGADKQIVRKSVRMTCKELPGFVGNEYGYPIEKFNDVVALPIGGK